MAGSLITLDKIRSAIARASSVDTIADLRNKARAIEVYSRQQRDCKAIEVEAVRIRLRAERRLGELLTATVKRGSKCSPGEHIPVGINRKQSSAWQRIAKLPASTFEKHLQSRQPSTKSLVRLADQHSRKRHNSRGPATGGGIVTGDMSVLFKKLEDNSVDLFLSDPPYTDVQAYGKLAELAAVKLRDGGLCAAYSSTLYLPKILGLMSEHLTYWWTISSVRQGCEHLAVWNRRIQSTWQPIILFAKGKPQRDWMTDCLRHGIREKQRHDWQQPEAEAEYLIEKLSDPGDLVVDPFAGSGTTLAAAKRLGRQYLGCELDANTARGARRRVLA